MKIIGNTILLESFKEAREVAYLPVDYEHPLGSLPAYYAVVLAYIVEEKRDSYVIAFASEKISEYFKRLPLLEKNHKLANFDFHTKEELERSWMGYGDNCIPRAKWHTTIPLNYLKVIQHILTVGVEHFTFKFYDDEDRLTEACIITSDNSHDYGRSFTIDRVIDPNLFDGLVKFLRRKTRVNEESVEQAARSFISGNS